MNNDPTAMIKEIDLTLSMLRNGWMQAKGEEKAKYMERINGVLDERLRWMAHRDRQ